MMEKNRFQELKGTDLDQLLNQAFLNLDFNQAQNQAMLEYMSNQLLVKTPFFSLSSLKKMIVNKLFLLLSVLVLCGGACFWLKSQEITTITPPADVTDLSTTVPVIKALATKAAEPIVVIKKKIPLLISAADIPPAKLKEPVAAARQESVVVSGYVISAKNKTPLTGAMIYSFHSSVGVSSGATGYFELLLPEGEHTLAVSLTSYQTRTVTLDLKENVTRNIELQEIWKELDEVTVKASDYIFPNLTPKQKKAIEKDKKNMARQVAKIRPDKTLQKYSFIPEPADKSLPGFFMGSGEVTNQEYRTFLFDLLIQGRKEEFLIAKPEQSLWKNAAGRHDFDTLSQVYFSDTKYLSYPVVNISVAGAEMYCDWLTRISNELRRKEGKPGITVRLPYEKEWLYAANAGHSDAVYAWPSDSIQNRANWFLANFCIQKQANKFKYPLGHPGKFDATAYTSAGIAMYGTGNTKIATIETWSYNPNDFNLYNVCGNASEMVYMDEKKTVKTKGGNWNSDFEHLKFNSGDEFKDNVKPSPMIGFRVYAQVKK